MSVEDRPDLSFGVGKRKMDWLDSGSFRGSMDIISAQNVDDTETLHGDLHINDG